MVANRLQKVVQVTLAASRLLYERVETLSFVGRERPQQRTPTANEYSMSWMKVREYS